MANSVCSKDFKYLGFLTKLPPLQLSCHLTLGQLLTSLGANRNIGLWYPNPLTLWGL